MTKSIDKKIFHNPAKKAAIYARVSTTDQDASMQLEALRLYCERHDLIIYKEYVDKGTGTNAKRKALQKMLTDARQRHFDTVLVWKIDRLARSVHHFQTIIGELDNKDIAFVATTQDIDTGTPVGRLLRTLLAAIAEFETELRKERQLEGIARAKRLGRHLGRPSKIDLNEAIRLREQGLSYKVIGEKLEVSKSTVINALKGSKRYSPVSNDSDVILETSEGEKVEG